MDDGSTGALAIWLIALWASAFVAWAEVALAVMGRLRVKQLLEGDIQDSETVEALFANPTRYLMTLSVLRVLAAIMGAGAAVWLSWRIRPSGLFTVIAVAATALILLIIHILANGIASRASERTVLRAFGLIRWLSYLLWPITWPLQRLARWARGAHGGDVEGDAFLNYETLRFLLQAGEEEGMIEQEEQEMIASIFEFGETLVREVMVPRIDIVAIDEETSLDEAVKVILEAGHSRIPVYQENIDNIIGLLYAKDLLRYFAEGRTDVEIREILRPAYFVPETKKVDELLQELQQRRVHMAIVVDEYGGTAGLVTIEDLLEEIVGEIQDEYDSEQPFVEEISESEFIFNARVDLDEVNKRLHIELPSEGGDTLGGFIYSQLGRVPVRGDVIPFDGVTLEVLSVDGQRIERVRVRRERPLSHSDKPSSDAPALLSFLIFR